MPYEEQAEQRWVDESPSLSGRGSYQRDRARVLHSSALRRLAGKTQVVEPDSANIPRTRLTHSLECAQIGRELGAALGCDADLVDAACLAHDLGHPPYGHNGETALDLAAEDCGGFEGNAQSLRLLTRLEVKVPGAGLNLTRATLDAATKYPWAKREGTTKYGVYEEDLPVFGWLRQGSPDDVRSLETHVMDWADDVAYSVHDLEDGVVAGLVDLRELAGDASRVAEVASQNYSSASTDEIAGVFTDLLAQPWWPQHYDGSTSSQIALRRATTALIGRFCRFAEKQTRERYGSAPLSRYDAELVVPEQARIECAALKAVTATYVMDRPGVRAVQERERETVASLVTLLTERGADELEPMYAEAWQVAADDRARLRVVVDQVAGLTDASAAGLLVRLQRA